MGLKFRGLAGQHIGDARGRHLDADLKLGAEKPAHLGRLAEEGAVAVVLALESGLVVGLEGLAITETGKNLGPGAVVADNGVVTQPADREDDVGVGEQAVQVNSAPVSGAGQISHPGRVVRVMYEQGHAAGHAGGQHVGGKRLGAPAE